MPYNIVLSNGDPLVTMADGVADNSYTSLTLFGKNFAGYGQFLNENFVHILENFCSSVPPFNPIVGQIWYDTLNHNMKVFTTGNTWKSLSGITSTSAPPSSPNNGDGWWDSINNQLFIWADSEWILLGPKWNSLQGKTEIEALTVIDTNGNGHTLLAFYINSSIVGIWNNDSIFDLVPEDAIGNFPLSIAHGLSFDTLNVETLNVSGEQINQGSLLVRGSITGASGTFKSLTSGRITFAGTGGLLTDDGDLTYNSQTNTLTLPGIQSTNLTSGRVTFAGTGGLLTDDGDLTYNSQTNILTSVGGFLGNTTGTHFGNTIGTHFGLVQSPPGQQMTGDLSGNFYGNVYAQNGRIYLANGSAAEPSLTFFNDGAQDTGIYWGGDGVLNFTNNGTYSGQIRAGGILAMVGDVIAFATSDRNLKTNIQPIENALSKLKKITGVMFDWTDEAIEKMGGQDGYLVRKRDTGVIAQDVELVLPEVVADRPDGSKAVRYEKLAGLIIQAINELAEEVEQLKNNKK